MLIQNIFSWGVAAMLSSLFLGTGSVDRNATSSQNGLTASVKEMKEAKGCATGFGKQSLIPFYFDSSNGYSKAAVETLSNWKPADLTHNCPNGNVKACMIFADPSHVDNPSNPTSLQPSISIVATQVGSFAILSSIVTDSSFENRN